jgi:hypothetical protein
MRSVKGTSGQIYTMEGVTASIILLGVLLFIIQANAVITPQTERTVDMKLYEKASDTLTVLDRSDTDSWSFTKPLKTYVVGWNGGTVTDGVQANMTELDDSISRLLPSDVQYSLSFLYNNSTGMHESHVIVHGVPADNSVVSTRLVTLNSNDAYLSSFWATTNNRFPQVVQVKLTCWYI